MATTPTLRTPETQVNTTDAAVGAGGNATQEDGQIVALGDGGYVVAWTDGSRAYNPAGTAVLGQRYDAAGQRAGGEFNISQLVVGDQSSPAVAALPGGGFAVAFVDSANNGDIYVRRYDVNLNLVGTDTIDASAAATTQPSLTAFADGSYLVAYTVGPAGTTDIEGRLVSPAGVVGSPFTIHSDPDDSDSSQLATLSNGNFVVVFRDDDNFLEDTVRFRVLQPDGTGVAQGFVSGAGQEDSDGDVAALRDGGFVIAHRVDDFMASNDDLHVTIFDNDGNAVRDFELAPGSNNDPDVVALTDGGFVVSWEGLEPGVGEEVRAQRLDAAGNLVGSRFDVHQPVPFDAPASAHAALLQDGRFAYAIRDISSGDLDVATSIWAAGNNISSLGDVVWQHADGMVATRDHELASVPNTWAIEGTADFDADGDSDILWHHAEGAVVTWELEDGQFVTNHNLPSAGGLWEIAGTGDFDDDGDDDILWSHPEGAVVTWEMQDGNYVQTRGLPSVSPLYHVAATGDFDGDGDSDIAWRHDEGGVVTWEMEGGSLVVNHNLPAVSNLWQIAGAGDFDGDGDDDILWRHPEGAVVTWEMESDALVATHGQPTVSEAGWAIEGVEDFDSDSDADILWRHTDGRVVMWEMEDGAYVINHNFGVVANTWQIQGTGEF